MVTHVHIVIILVGVFYAGMSFSVDNVLHSVTISSLCSVNRILPIRAAFNAKTGPLNRTNFYRMKSLLELRDWAYYLM